MTEPPFELGRIVTSIGPVAVLHRGVLAVEPRDGLTGRPATGVLVGLETARYRHELSRRRREGPHYDPYPARALTGVLGSRFVLRYSASTRPELTIRVDGSKGSWVRRRFAVAVRSLAAVAAADLVSPPAGPAAGAYVPAASRLLQPWLLPGAAYPLPRGTTGARLRVTRAGVAVPWTRVEAFGADGSRIGWGHGDEHGQVVIVFAGTGTQNPPESARFDVALRVHAPPGGTPSPPEAPLEPVPLFDAPAGPDADLLRGISPPSGYVPFPDLVHRHSVGELAVLPDHKIGSP